MRRGLIVGGIALICACGRTSFNEFDTVADQGESSAATSADTSSESSAETGAMIDLPGDTDTATTTTGDGDGDTGDGDGDPAGVCGDGVVDAGEACDLGELNDDSGACTSACAEAICGDGLVFAGVEDCDDGDLDDSDACTSLCSAPACDDGIRSGDETDVDCGGGCSVCLVGQACAIGDDCESLACDVDTCAWPLSCADLRVLEPALGDGIYSIDPLAQGPYEVACDMTTSGGGWTLVLVASDDGDDTFTWDQQTLLSTDTTLVGDIGSLDRDFKSAAYHEVGFADVLFRHAPSDVWAQYDAVGDGAASFGGHVEAVGAPICDDTLPGNGHELSDGTLTAGGGLCDTDLYFNLGDHDYGVDNCNDLAGGLFNNATYGPVWNSGFNDGCDFDDPSYASLGPSNPCNGCPDDEGARETNSIGWGEATASNTGQPDQAENFMVVYVR